jgi:hypothetical protein
VFCDADTSGDVRLVRQLGGSACRQGETWGVSSRGIWVDRGCRAEFEVASRGGGVRGSSTLVCTSASGGRVRCDANTSGGVRLIRQLGGRCLEGQTWGWDNRGIWVDRGCSAEFQVQR